MEIGPVVLLHGLGRTAGSWRLMQAALRGAGHEVLNAGYPSTRAPMGELVEWLGAQVAGFAPGQRVNFVTHSMGGILLRAWAAGAAGRVGRVVMLAPPNAGSELVDAFGDLDAFRWAFGPAGQVLGTGANALPGRLAPPDYEVGVIAGNLSLNPLTSALIEGPNDGKVSVRSTRLEGAAHLELPVSHTWLMNNPVVIAQTLQFLKEGRFAEEVTMAGAV
ncbi:MAG: esterase/lipase family protein, partial [Paracoccaceae bacterium]